MWGVKANYFQKALARDWPASQALRTGQNGCASVMVSDSLTLAL
jgi:hypothetical protein